MFGITINEIPSGNFTSEKDFIKTSGFETGIEQQLNFV